MKNLSCSCRVWDLNGIPCPHAICAIQHNGDAVDFIAHWYKKTTYMKTYEETLKPVKSSKYWPKSGLEPPLPPPKREMPGRCKHKRRRDPDEPKKMSKLSKKYSVMRRRQCKGVGHNRAGCPNKSVSNRASKGKGKATQKKSATKRPRMQGLGIYTNPVTGLQILNPHWQQGHVIWT
ncbi:SWIM domain-containing protein [Cephalotus follicularis]|uniref:SWIM domain-containing protein n=1 Tax=Cephalotus follicularis TaxID=3775 RepID=A0A1Q3DE25_CEPFO|nr:SWIM domain-containing protein [Cephalotus follicularis]